MRHQDPRRQQEGQATKFVLFKSNISLRLLIIDNVFTMFWELGHAKVIHMSYVPAAHCLHSAGHISGLLSNTLHKRESRLVVCFENIKLTPAPPPPPMLVSRMTYALAAGVRGGSQGVKGSLRPRAQCFLFQASSCHFIIALKPLPFPGFSAAGSHLWLPTKQGGLP